MLGSVLFVVVSALFCHGAPAAAKVSAEGDSNSNSVEVNVTAQANYLEASLYLYAPQSWIDVYQQIPEEELECFLNLANDQSVVVSAQDAEFFNQLKQKCPTDVDKLIAFFTQINSTVSQLPTSLLNAFQTFKTKIDAVQNKAKSQPGNNKFNPALAQQAGQAFTDLIKTFAGLSTEDKAKFASVFPKLAPFISGDKALAFQNDVVEVLNKATSLGSNPNTDAVNALKTKFEAFKTDYNAVSTQFLDQNKDNIAKASEIAGVDFTARLKEGLNFGAWAGGVPADGNTFSEFGETAQNDLEERALAAQTSSSDQAELVKTQFVAAEEDAEDKASEASDKIKLAAESAASKFSGETSKEVAVNGKVDGSAGSSGVSGSAQVKVKGN